MITGFGGMLVSEQEKQDPLQNPIVSNQVTDLRCLILIIIKQCQLLITAFNWICVFMFKLYKFNYFQNYCVIIQLLIIFNE